MTSAFAFVLFVALGPPPTEAPVEVQRPTVMVPAEPAAEAPIEPPQPPAESTPFEPASSAPSPAPTPTRGRIDGTLLDRELAGVGVPGAAVELRCSCLTAPILTVSDPSGAFVVEDLPSGVYTVLADRGGAPTKQIVSLAPGQWVELELTVAPPTTTAELDRRTAIASRARTMLAIGGVAEVGAFALLIGAAVEKAKHACMFDQEDCARAPRPAVAAGLAITGGLLAVGGGTLIGIGAHRLRRLRAQIAVDDRTLGLLVQGRF